MADTNAPKRWYVFDQDDTYFSYENAVEAAKNAEVLILMGLTGIHIVYMTEAQNDEYCRTGNLRDSLLVAG